MAGFSAPSPPTGSLGLPTNPRGAPVANATPLPPSIPKAPPASRYQDQVAALYGPEEISERTVTSLQVASGIRSQSLDLTAYDLVRRLDLVLNQAWLEVRPTLDLRDLWTVAQVEPHLQGGPGIEMNSLESLLGETEDSDVDPGGARDLLPKVRSWNLVTRWAVLRAVANSLESAMKRGGNRHVIPNRLIEDEFRKALTA